MIRWLLLLVLVAAVAGSALFLGPTDPPPPSPDEAVERNEALPKAGPLLRGAGDDASGVPLASRGRGGIVGNVVRGGTPAAAAIALRLVETLATSDPLGAWRGASFVGRILDGGMARTAPIAETRSGTDGTFAFEGLGAGIYELRGYAPDGSSALATVSLPGAGARVDVRLELAAGGLTLEGHVEYAGGTPFVGSVVVEPVVNGGFSGFTPTSGSVVAPTDRDGNFAAPGLTAGAKMLGVVDPGRLRLFGVIVTLPHEGPYRLVIGKDSSALRGRVVSDDDERPIAGAAVTGGGGAPGTGILLSRVRTDDDGRFELLLPPGEGGVFVEATGYAPLTTEWGGGNEEEFELRLQRTAGVTGRVVDAESRAGVAGTWVFAVPSDMRGFSLAFPSAARTDASGRFALADVTPTTVAIFALGEGVATPALADVRADGYNPLETSLEPGERKEIELEVGPAGHARGHVRTTDGRPVRGAAVAFETQHALIRGLQQTAFFGGGHGAVVTDADGAFETHALVPSATYRVRVEAAGHPTFKAEEFVAVAGETHEMEILLPAVQWVEVLVQSKDGTPLTARVAAAVRAEDSTSDGDWAPLVGTWLSGADGRARLGPLPPGSIGVLAVATDHLERTTWVEASAADVTTLVLDPGLVLAGRVVVPAGAEPGAVRFDVQPDSPSAGWRTHHPTADATGRWRLGGLAEGTYEIEATLQHGEDEWATRVVATAGQDDVVVTLEAPDPEEVRRLTITLRGPDGEAVPAADVTLRTESGSGSTSHHRSVSGGRVVFDLSAEERNAVLHVEVYDARGGRFGATVAGPFDASQGEIEIVMSPALAIQGRVEDEAGGPVEGAVVEARHRSVEYDVTTHDRAFSDEQGRFELGGLGDFDYTVGVKVPGEYAEPAPVEVHAGATNVRIVLQAARTARVTVLDARGSPVAGAWVVARSPRPSRGGNATTGHLQARAFTQADGVAGLEGLAPGTYQLAVQTDDSAGFKRAVIDGWTVEDTTVRLEDALTIEGVVHAPGGTPVHEALVVYTADGGETTGMVQTDDEGRFRVPQLDAGRVRLKASVGSVWAPQWTDEGSVEAQAGAKGVVLVVDPGASLVVVAVGWRRPGEANFEPWDIQVMLLGDGESPELQFGNLDEKGTASFQGLDPARTYSVRIADDKGRYAHARGVRPGDRVELGPTEGHAIAGRVILPAGIAGDRVSLTLMVDGFFVHESVRPDGTFQFQGLPDGRHEIAAYVHREDESGGPPVVWQGMASARPGDSPEIQLERAE